MRMHPFSVWRPTGIGLQRLSNPNAELINGRVGTALAFEPTGPLFKPDMQISRIRLSQ